MPVAKITQRTIDAIEPGANPYIVFDSALKGFGIRVMPSGAMAWIIEYRPGGGGRKVGKRRFKFGDIGDFKPDKARDAASGLLAKVRLGADPAGERTAARVQMTVDALIDDFLADADAKLKSRTAAGYKSILRQIVSPAIGTRKVDQVTRSALARLHLSLKDTPIQANRMLGTVGTMYAYAAMHHIVSETFNPARKIPHFKEKGRERFLTGGELDALGTALREAETTGLPWVADPDKPVSKHTPKKPENRIIKPGAHAIGAIRLLLLTGCRLREILNLRWAEVNLERGLLMLPDSKTGRKTVVLNAPAMAVLANLPRVGAFVCAGENAGTKNEKPRHDLKRPWMAVCRRAGLSSVRLHDLRHTHASIAAVGGLGLPIIGKLLGHKHAATTARYAHLDLDPARRASEFIGARLSEAMAEKTEQSKSGAEVIPLRR